MNIEGSVIAITGASRGIGRVYVTQALERGARKVYALTRTAVDFDDDRVVNILLDVTDSDAIALLPGQMPDVEIFVNCAGALSGPIMTTSLADMRIAFDLDFFAPIELSKTLAPVIESNGGGAFINVLSVLAWIPYGAYGAAKAALWSASNALRLELAPRNIRVVSVHVGTVDTDMAAGLDVPKVTAASVVTASYDGLAAGDHEVLADEASVLGRRLLAGPIEHLHL